MASIQQQFRATKKQKIVDAAAGKKPLSSGDKAGDKLQVEQLAQQIADVQEILYAERKHKILIVLQGMDTSGKDGTVRGVFGKIDPLGVSSIAFKAPTAEEKAHDYLWRVHQQVPGLGEFTIFNRSHYEDVLITRVHDWIDNKECARRYEHIRAFEKMLAETGTVILKFFLHISSDAQKQRLEERIAYSDKHWKFDPNDLEERKYWSDYQRQYAKAIAETDAAHAPWYVIPADSKTHRNLAIASILLDTLQKLKPAFPPANPAFAKLKVV
ncbi:PPK2 family polyphosphate kinase [Herminiimonas fonticola]|uniref:PPK2 family polyphosphate:nucleotide phosphotransferase n=1 Tax=Herminiimonas fonticola TaxID=303380 RepID=A0A4R6GFV0_9BURK|nr:PPK2 family polyphosphate kinase [Herminiimonas fonticola]RBA24629.1 polyphosphate:nucleotide phosphotransferase, PPK2 family [Herminiimonas fonticola]TDN93746.1 PPK2 family polyphosphate:nucleotide phosphotransferase [Herminiimonas fonticola]